MALAVRIWPIELDPKVILGEWGPLQYGGSLGERAPWRFEPSYWEPMGMLTGLTPVRVEDFGLWEYELPRDDLRALDSNFRSRALPWQKVQFEVMDRALAESSPFLRFAVAIYEWESGLPD